MLVRYANSVSVNNEINYTLQLQPAVVKVTRCTAEPAYRAEEFT